MEKKGKVLAIVQTRIGSSRFPGKVLKEICGRPMLSLMLERLSKSNILDDIVVATTTKQQDDVIVEIARKNGYKIFRGSELDCLDRHYKAAKKFSVKYVAKITSDSPLIDPEVVDTVITYFLDNEDKFDYVSNVHPPTFPDGLDVEIFHFETLEKAWKETTDPYQREHTTTYIHSQPSLFRIGSVIMPDSKNLFFTHRWAVDYPEDLEFVKAVYEALYNNGRIFHMDEILELLEKRPDIRRINEHLTVKNRVH